jgi:hypothetical protein
MNNSNNGNGHRPPKPQAVAVQPELIPDALRRLRQWVDWRYDYRKDKWTKPLSQPNGECAESDNPNTWGTFDEALAAYLQGGFDGIGFVVTGDDGLAGVDLDHCRDPETGAIEPWALRIVQALNSYTEVSPSGTGLRVFLWAKLPPKDRKLGNFECYESGRYLTVTGNHLEGTPTTIEHRQAEMDAVHTEVFAERNKPRANGKISPPSALPNLDDRELLDKAFNAKNGEAIWRLYHGDHGKYDSHSEADLALCGHLAFYAGPDPQKIDRLYRASDLCSPKWDDPRGNTTWGGMTVAKALDGRTEFYQPGRSSTNGHRAANEASTFEPDEESESEDWPERQPLPDKPAAPTLPIDMIPEPYRRWVLDVAAQACFPPEMVLIPALVGTASIIGRKLWIRPWRFNSYTFPPNLWGAIVARPASLKSHAIDEGLKPVKRLAATAHSRFQAEITHSKAHLFAIEAEVDGLKNQMKKAARQRKSTGNLEEELAVKLQELEIAQPGEKRYWVADSTPEKLADLLKENPNGLLISYDELSGWLADMEKPGREGARAFYLAGWEGKNDHYVDRIGRGANYIPAVCLSLMGGIQPDRLQRHLDEAISGDSGGDGMIQRFQLLIQIDNLGDWKAPEKWPDSIARNTVYGMVKWLDETDLAALGTKDEEAGVSYLCFDPEAQAVADQWRDELEARLRGSELNSTPAFEAHLGKYRSLMPSLALIFHLINQTAETAEPFSGVNSEKFSSQVSQEAVELAADWCDFLEEHARVIYQAEVSPGRTAAHLLAERIKAGRVRHGDPVRDIYNHKWSGLSTSAQVLNGLEVLEAAGWVRVVIQQTGGNPTTLVHLHPDLRGGQNG